MKIFRLTVLVLVFISSTLYGGDRTGGYIMTAEIPFKGKATGGTLILGNVRGRNVDFASVETLPGESGEAVVYKLAKVIAYSDAIFEISEWENIDRERMLANMAQGDILRITNFPLGLYFLAGSEKGFGIPQSPLSLSCTYDKTKDEIVLNWENAIGDYNYIFVNGGRIPGNSTSMRISRQKTGYDVNNLDIRVFGYSNGLPSGVAAVYLEQQGTVQGELFGIPFADIAPNWKVWSTGNKVKKNIFEQANKYVDMQSYNPVSSLSTKPFYQVIKGSKDGGSHGIYRKFMGLTPGHTYRIIANLTTLDMNDSKDWSAALCAAYNQAKDKDLASQQMAGLSVLPDGKKGEKAGEIASFGKGRKNTKGNFSIVCSDANSCITLPQDVNTITVWVRFNCNDPNGKVGFSGVKLEDITDNRNIKTLEQIQQEESLQEINLINKEKTLKMKK
jgi:hypothetical protein